MVKMKNHLLKITIWVQKYETFSFSSLFSSLFYREQGITQIFK